MMKVILLIIFMHVASFVKSQQAVHFHLELAELTDTTKIYNFVVDDYMNIVAWQYRMFFDDSKMQFTEIRNSLIEGLGTSSFNAVSPGILLTAGFDPDLEPDDLPDGTVAYQIVFRIITLGGSTLCFSEDPSDYEIAIEENGSDMELDKLTVSDDCNTGLLLILNPTSIGDPIGDRPLLVEKIFLSSGGEFSFTALQNMEVELFLYDILGRRKAYFNEAAYPAGRNYIDTKTNFPSGIYIMQMKYSNGKQDVTTLFVTERT